MQRIEKSIRVAAPTSVVYQYWRNFENFPKFMENVDEVRKLDAEGRLSHWRLKGPLGTKAEFESELTQDQPNRSIGWNSRDGSLGSSGNVTFTETDNNTVVHVIMQWYDPPAGPVGEAVSRILQNPEQMLEGDLQRFKEVVEKNAGQSGRRAA
jgi:uncharacterized membrane protein